MALELRPTCEHCTAPLAPGAPGAYICSYECTFCEQCSADLLDFVCPNCTGPLVPRPFRPSEQLEFAPGSRELVESAADLDAHGAKVQAAALRDGRPAHLWEVVVDCLDPALLARFYGELLEVPAVVRHGDWTYVEPRPRGPLRAMGTNRGVRIAFQRVPEERSGKVRIHLDLAADDLEAFADRAVAMGAVRLAEFPDDPAGPFIVLADPEGHEFCVVSSDGVADPRRTGERALG